MGSTLQNLRCELCRESMDVDDWIPLDAVLKSGSREVIIIVPACRYCVRKRYPAELSQYEYDLKFLAQCNILDDFLSVKPSK